MSLAANVQQSAAVEARDAEMATRVRATVRGDIRAMHAYAVPRADGLIKLDAMENPYPLPAEVRARLAAAVAGVAINRYPDAAAETTKHALRDAFALGDGFDIVLGNGSDELISMLTAMVAGEGATILAPEPSFVMYAISARLANVRYVGVPLGHGFALDTDAMLAAIARERPALVWLAFPNNPTGNLFDVAAIEAIVDAAPGLVVIDEAYYAFANRSFILRAREFSNVIVVRTVSKIGMAGLRLGYAVGDPVWMRELEKLRPPYNVNALTQAVAPLLLAEEALLAEQARAICTERERVAAALVATPGVVLWPTHTNFVLIRVADAAAMFEQLRHAGILVKNLGGSHPSLANCLRITIGTPDENDALLRAIGAQP
ncbi:MAG: histidinol-phosphate transaminase [Casimicrobiaceae bacterium]